MSAPLPPIEPLTLELGYRLVPLVQDRGDVPDNASLIAAIKAWRAQLLQESGLVLPPLQLRDNLQLGPTDWRLMVWGAVIAQGAVQPDCWLASAPTDAPLKLTGVKTVHPISGQQATWIPDAQRARAMAQGAQLESPAALILAAIEPAVYAHWGALFGFDALGALLDSAAVSTPAASQGPRYRPAILDTLQAHFHTRGGLHAPAEWVHILTTPGQDEANRLARLLAALRPNARVPPALKRPLPPGAAPVLGRIQPGEALSLVLGPALVERWMGVPSSRILDLLLQRDRPAPTPTAELQRVLDAVQAQLRAELGITMAPIAVHAHPDIDPHAYEIHCGSTLLCQGQAPADHLVIAPRTHAKLLGRQRTPDPIFGLPSSWNDSEQLVRAAGGWELSRLDVILIHLLRCGRSVASRIFGPAELTALMGQVEDQGPAVVKALNESSAERRVAVLHTLRCLLDEQIPITPLWPLVERVLCEPEPLDLDALADALRRACRHQGPRPGGEEGHTHAAGTPQPVDTPTDGLEPRRGEREPTPDQQAAHHARRYRQALGRNVEGASTTPLAARHPAALIVSPGIAPTARLDQRMARLRREQANHTGIWPPKIQVQPRTDHGERTVRLMVGGRQVASATFDSPPEALLAIDPDPGLPGRVLLEEANATETREPAFGLVAYWIAPEHRQRAAELGCTVVDQATVIATLVSRALQRATPQLLTLDTLDACLAPLRDRAPLLWAELQWLHDQGHLDRPALLTLFRALLAEGVSLRPTELIVQTLVLGIHSRLGPADLLAAIRLRLARQICGPLVEPDGSLQCFSLHPNAVPSLTAALAPTPLGSCFAPTEGSPLHAGLETFVTDIARDSEQSGCRVLLTPAKLRFALATLLTPRVPELMVLSPQEIPAGLTLALRATVGSGLADRH